MIEDDDEYADLDEEERAAARAADEATRGRPSKVVDHPRDAAGTLKFRSPAWLLVVLIPLVGGGGAVIQDEPLIGVAAGALGLWMLVYAIAPATRLVIGEDGTVTVRSGLWRRPIPLEHYRYVRCCSTPGAFRRPASIVCLRRRGPHPLAPLSRFSARFRPWTTRRRTVIFFSTWYDAQGRMLSPYVVCDVVMRGCRRGGMRVTKKNDDHWVARAPGD